MPTPDLEKTAQKLALVSLSTDADLPRLRDVFGLTDENLGRMTGFSPTALTEWGKSSLPNLNAQWNLRNVLQVFDRLNGCFS